MLSGVSSRSPCEAQPVTATENVCRQVESHSCRIHGETFMFEVQSASIVPDRPDQAVLQIAVFRRTASGLGPAATMRVTAPLHEIGRWQYFNVAGIRVGVVIEQNPERELRTIVLVSNRAAPGLTP